MSGAETTTDKTTWLAGDFAASIVVFLVALPLCMGVAIASGVPVSAGLFTGIIAGLVVGPLAGCPLQVSGPAAGLAVIVYGIVQRFGLDLLGLIVLLAGLFQLIAGVARIGQWFRAVSPAVITGMLAGIGALIFLSQFHVMLDARPSGSALQDLINIPTNIRKAFTQGGLAPYEQRASRTEYLKRISQVRTHQVEVYTELTQLLPRNAKNPRTMAARLQRQLERPHPSVLRLGERQEWIAADLQAISRIVLEKEQSSETLRARQIVVAARAADAAMSDAIKDLESGRLLPSIQSQAAAVDAVDDYLSALKNHALAAQIGLFTITVIVIWKIFAPVRLRAIPGPLVAVILATLLAAGMTLPIIYVNVPDQLVDELRLIDWSTLRQAPWLAILQAAAVLAAVASAETLLCATATDQLHGGPRTKYNRELRAQGIGNMLCGIIGALPMTGVIVRSTANIEAGGESRWSATLHGVWLLLFIVLFSGFLELIPTSVLAAILVYTGYRLMNPQSIRDLARFGWGEVAIYAVTVITIVAINLLTGIVAGVLLATAKLLYQLSGLRAELLSGSDPNLQILILSGSATFLSLPKLASKLDQVPKGSRVSVAFRRLKHIDHACLQLLMNWSDQHKANGGTIEIDWKSLAKRFGEEHELAITGPQKQDDVDDQSSSSTIRTYLPQWPPASNRR